MLLDILSDRGFSGAYIVNERIVPARINPDTWKVENEIDLIHKFRCVLHSKTELSHPGPKLRFAAE